VSTGRYIARGRGRAAAYKCGGAQGITLLELLVVLAILGLMAAVAIPTFAKFGFFSRNETQQGARELYKVLSATRVLAATNRVNTAVAYAVTYEPDSLIPGQNTKTIGSFAIVQKLPEGYELIVGGTKVTDEVVLDMAFVPATEMQGVGIFRPMPQDTALLAVQSYADEENGLYGSSENIHIYPGEYSYDAGERRWSFRSDGELTQADGTDTSFPAHVFTPSGRMEWSKDKERCKIHVAYPPDADTVERFADLKEIDPENIKLSDFRTIDLELYRGTGRVQIVREES